MAEPIEGHEDLMTIGQIAEMAGAGEDEAASWTREPGFPQPLADTEQGPVYLRGEVRDWLRETGKKGERPTAF
jgi:hypothetical protein